MMDWTGCIAVAAVFICCGDVYASSPWCDNQYAVTIPQTKNKKDYYMSSSDYKDDYDKSNQSTCWIFTLASSSSGVVTVELTTLDVDESINCTKDSLEIRDGRYETSTLLAKLCGHLGFHSYRGSGHYMHVRFKTSCCGVRNGFKMRYYRFIGGFWSSNMFQIMAPIVAVIFIIIMIVWCVKRRTWQRRQRATNMATVQQPTVVNPNTGMPYATQGGAPQGNMAPIVINPNTGMPYASPGGAPQGNYNMAYTPGMGVNMQNNQAGMTPQYGGVDTPAGGAPGDGNLPPSYNTIYSTDQTIPSKH